MIVIGVDVHKQSLTDFLPHSLRILARRTPASLQETHRGSPLATIAAFATARLGAAVDV